MLSVVFPSIIGVFLELTSISRRNVERYGAIQSRHHYGIDNSPRLPPKGSGQWTRGPSILDQRFMAHPPD